MISLTKFVMLISKMTAELFVYAKSNSWELYSPFIILNFEPTTLFHITLSKTEKWKE